MGRTAIAGLYTDDATVLTGAATLLVIAGIFQFADGVQVTCNGVLRGLKDARVPMLLTACAYWGVGVPLGLTLAFTAGLGAAGMWVGLTAGLATAAVLLMARVVLVLRRYALPHVSENRDRPLTPRDATGSIA
jgi:MATE family multidrug resistance protein